jgi:hypothetical protein
MRNRVLACREQMAKKKVPTDWIDLFYRDVVG